MTRPRILLADDHLIIADLIKNLLAPDYDVVGVYNNGEALVAAAADLAPDLAILDVCMPRMNGLSACARLRSLFPKMKIVFLTMNEDADTAGEAFRTGAQGYVLKTCAASELKIAIREVLRGGYYAPESLTNGMIGSFVQNFKKMKPAIDLTARQKEVLKLLTEGRSMKQVAYALNITPRTVAFHKYAMMEQLNISSSAELFTYALKQPWA